MAPKGGSKQQSEEDLLLQDFSRNLSAKSSALFFGNAFIVSAIPICELWAGGGGDVAGAVGEAAGRRGSGTESPGSQSWRAFVSGAGSGPGSLTGTRVWPPVGPHNRCLVLHMIDIPELAAWPVTSLSSPPQPPSIFLIRRMTEVRPGPEVRGQRSALCRILITLREHL